MSDTNGPQSGGHRLFISFCSHDKFIAKRLCEAIEAQGRPCWISTRDVPLGGNYQDCISTAIETASAMVLVFSENSNNSSEVKKELALAGQYRTVVIPVRTEDVLPAGAFRYELSTRQWVDLFTSWDGAVAQIVECIGELVRDGSPLGPIPPRPPPPNGRSSWSRIRALGGSRRGRALGVSVASVALVASGVLLAPQLILAPKPVPPLVPRDETGDKPAFYAETEATRLTAFTLCTPSSEVKPGFRHWTRVAPDRWVEQYPDGTRAYMNLIKRINVAFCDGSVLGTAFDASFQVFVPDKGCMAMAFLFRRLPTRGWTSYVSIDGPDLTCGSTATSAR